MTISVVLRVAQAALAAGRLAGEAEVVATGERVVVKDARELVAFLSRSAVPVQSTRNDRGERD